MKRGRLPARAKLAVVALASLVLASLAATAALQLELAPAYPEFVVGHLAWHAGTKLQDLIAAPLFVAVLVGSFWWLVRRFGATSPPVTAAATSGATSDLATLLMWWALPAIAAIAGAAIGSSIDVRLVFISAAGVLCVLIVSAHGILTEGRVRHAWFGMVLFAALLLSAIPLELALIRGRAPVRLAGDPDLFGHIQATFILITLGFAMVTSMALSAPERLSRRLPELLLIGQLGLPAFFLTLYPARLAAPDGTITKYGTALGLRVLIVAAIIIGVVDVVRRYRQTRSTEQQAGDYAGMHLLSPIALFALLIAWFAGTTTPPHISADDYHFGELLLGSWSYLQGTVPYVGYIPPHGLIEDDLAGILSFLFYDGTAGSILEARRLAIGILGFIAFIALLRFFGSLGLAVVSVAFLSWSLTWLFLTPFVCLWLSPSLRTNPARWLSIWIITTPIVILGTPAQGLLLVAASAVMAVTAIWRLWRVGGWREWTRPGLALAVIGAAVGMTPVGLMLLGAVGYVLENGPVNQLAYGIPWALSWSAAPPSGLLFEAIRMSWIIVPAACLAIILISIKTLERRGLLLPVLVILVFVLLMIPYAMGRIDPGGVSRAGRLASFGWAVLLPVVAWHWLRPRHKTLLIVAIAGMSAALNFTPVSLSALMASAAPRIATGPLRDGEAAGLGPIGRATVEDAHWQRLTRLDAVISDALAPEQSYLDLTSRNAHYFYFNRKPPIAITAPYNMVPLAQQQRAVAALVGNPPPLALLAADNIVHDGGSLALRTPLLYRFVVDHYIPRWENGFIVGDRKKYDEPAPAEVTLDVGIKTLTDVNWDRGVSRHEAAVILDDPVLASVLTPGVPVRFPQGERRTIVRAWAEGQAIWLDGAIPGRPEAAPIDRIQVTIDDRAERTYRAALFQEAFSVSDLARISVAWGRSESSLHERMERIASLDAQVPAVHDAAMTEGRYRVTGPDPYLVFDLAPLAIAGRDAGLLRLEFACHDRRAETRLQIFWWGDEQTGPDEAASVRITADDGVLLVPLDAFPRWLTLGHIRGLRLDLDNAHACATVIVKDLALYQRLAVQAE